jgi:hypothetical protein
MSLAIGQITITDLNDAGIYQGSMDISGTAIQTWDPTNGVTPFTPDWGISNVTLTPTMTFSSDAASGDMNATIATWTRITLGAWSYKADTGAWLPCSGQGTFFSYLGTQGVSTPWRMKIIKNCFGTGGIASQILLIKFDYIYTDPTPGHINTALGLSCFCPQAFVANKSGTSQNSLFRVEPFGTEYNTLNGSTYPNYVQLGVDFIRGSALDTTQNDYFWYKLDASGDGIPSVTISPGAVTTTITPNQFVVGQLVKIDNSTTAEYRILTSSAGNAIGWTAAVTGTYIPANSWVSDGNLPQGTSFGKGWRLITNPTSGLVSSDILTNINFPGAATSAVSGAYGTGIESASNYIRPPREAITNYGIFKVILVDKEPQYLGQTYTMSFNVSDYLDPMKVEIFTTNATSLPRGVGRAILIARCYINGAEDDPLTGIYPEPANFVDFQTTAPTAVSGHAWMDMTATSTAGATGVLRRCVSGGTWANAVIVPPTATGASGWTHTYTWKSYDANGNAQSFTATTGPAGTTRTGKWICVEDADIVGQAKFIVDVN